MIKLSNGQELMFLASSGALAYDGKGWPWEWPLRWLKMLRPEEFVIVTKTLTLEPRKGTFRWYAPWRTLRFIPNGVVNADGFRNQGLKWWIDKVYPNLDRRYQFVVSIFPANEAECKKMMQMLNWCRDIVAVEINLSCPNIEHDTTSISYEFKRICIMARKTSLHPLILKVGFTHNVKDIKTACHGFEALALMNTVPWSILFPNKESPLGKIGGGVSGPIIFPLLREKLRELIWEVKIPMIVGGGISSQRNIDQVCPFIQNPVSHGPGAVSFGTLFLQKPWLPNQIVSELTKSNP